MAGTMLLSIVIINATQSNDESDRANQVDSKSHVDRLRDSSSRCILFDRYHHSGYDFARENSAEAIEAILSFGRMPGSHESRSRPLGAYKHSNELLNDTSSFMNKTYLPIEVEWMRGKG